ncbi:hypothetical protein [Escherichia coli]|uniref:hypothetical protein n=1 Tax=Escherichia coli TaxID=562 RepID=UPI00259CB983|nr:hypothetical protein [Escherichia coli]MDM4874627.1 hypothetical protein [Escherichia coli]
MTLSFFITVIPDHDKPQPPGCLLEKAQGRDVNEQDGLILDAIDRYQAKFEAEGLAFNRQETEAELLHHDFTREVAEDRLEQQFVQEKAEQQNQQQSEQER